MNTSRLAAVSNLYVAGAADRDGASWWQCVILGLGIALLAPGSRAQIRDQIVVTSHDVGILGPVMRRYDRRLNLLGSTNLFPETMFSSLDTNQTEIIIAPDGRIWLPAQNGKLVRLEPNGDLLPSVVLDLSHDAISLTSSASGVMYALTSMSSGIPKPVYAVDAGGSILWSNDTGPKQFGSNPPDTMAVTVDGRLWIGDSSDGACVCQINHGLLLRLDTTNGNILQQVHMAPNPAVESFYTNVSAAPDGGVWAVVLSAGFGSFVLRVNETGIVKQFPVLSTNNSVTFELRIDAAGDMWAVSNLGVADGALLRKYSQVDGQLLTEINIGDTVAGFALGASGEDIIAVTQDVTPPFYRLVRVNLTTERWSARSLDPFIPNGIGHGDPSGFIHANIIDQGGDSDGDGATNREETLAGSSPYDALSRPEGPKAYVSFAASNNAIILELRDPDGVLHPTSGLDLTTLSVKIGPYGEVLPYLLPFLTFVQFSAEQTAVTAFFGALPLASNAKLTVDVQVTDQTGAVGWDWQVTPPGEL